MKATKKLQLCYRVTVVKDKESRRSKGVAFVLYIDRESAFKCVHSLNKTQVILLLLHVALLFSVVAFFKYQYL